jgi:hypothetical protein
MREGKGKGGITGINCEVLALFSMRVWNAKHSLAVTAQNYLL